LSLDVTRVRRATRVDNIDTFRCNFIFGPSWTQDIPVVIGFRPRRRASIVQRIKRALSSLLSYTLAVLIADIALLTFGHLTRGSEAGREQSRASRNEHSRLVHKGTNRNGSSPKGRYDDDNDRSNTPDCHPSSVSCQYIDENASEEIVKVKCHLFILYLFILF